jgi:hypothetical protein
LTYIPGGREETFELPITGSSISASIVKYGFVTCTIDAWGSFVSSAIVRCGLNKGFSTTKSLLLPRRDFNVHLLPANLSWVWVVALRLGKYSLVLDIPLEAAMEVSYVAVAVRLKACSCFLLAITTAANPTSAIPNTAPPVAAPIKTFLSFETPWGKTLLTDVTGLFEGVRLGLAVTSAGAGVMGDFDGLLVVGLFDGRLVGATEGLDNVGETLGRNVGLNDGFRVSPGFVGASDGRIVGCCEGDLLGLNVGRETVGEKEGFDVWGLDDGLDVGREVEGVKEGFEVCGLWEGLLLGENVGLVVCGLNDGETDGSDIVGVRDGAALGEKDGFDVWGDRDGLLLGEKDGFDDVGETEGDLLGFREGFEVDGDLLGLREGLEVEGLVLGCFVGNFVGDIVGRFVGNFVGKSVGWRVGDPVGGVGAEVHGQGALIVNIVSYGTEQF